MTTKCVHEKSAHMNSGPCVCQPYILSAIVYLCSEEGMKERTSENTRYLRMSMFMDKDEVWTLFMEVTDRVSIVLSSCPT